MAASTRPLTLGEILDRTVELYRRNFLLFAGISSLPSAIMVLAVGIVAILLGTQFATLKSAGNESTILIVVLVSVALLIGVPILLAAFSLSLGASNFAVLHVYRGEKVTIRSSYGYAFKHFWRHVGILLMQILLAWVVPYMIFSGILVVGSIVSALLAKSGAGTGTAGPTILVILFVLLSLALLAACTLIWVRFSLAFSATVAEDKKVWPSMQRSGELTKGSRGRIFVMFLLIAVLSGTIGAALMIPVFIVLAVVFQKSFAGPSPPPMFIILLETANLSISFLVRAFVTPIYSVALLLFYYDQRTRHEGYDIELLMDRAGWSEVPPPAPPTLPPPPVPPQAATVYPSVELPPMPAAMVPPLPGVEPYFTPPLVIEDVSSEMHAIAPQFQPAPIEIPKEEEGS